MPLRENSWYPVPQQVNWEAHKVEPGHIVLFDFTIFVKNNMLTSVVFHGMSSSTFGKVLFPEKQVADRIKIQLDNSVITLGHRYPAPGRIQQSSRDVHMRSLKSIVLKAKESIREI